MSRPDDRPDADAAQPEVAQPEVAQPEVAQPEVAQPDVAQPAAAAPVAGPDDEKTRELRVPPPGEEVTHRLPACAPHEEVTVKLPAPPPPAASAPEDPAPGDPAPGGRTGGDPVPVPAGEHPVGSGPATPTLGAEATAPYDEEEPGGEYEPDTAGRAAARMRPVSVAGAVIALLVGLLGFALVVQLRSNATDPGLATARPEDLVRILSDLNGRQDRLRQEIASLEESQRQLASGAQGREAALEEARRRADALGILAGTLLAQGPGLQVRFVPGGEGIPASTVLDAVEELRGAGGEAMQISGERSPAVRIVALTYFSDERGRLVVDGARLTGPYTLVVIGDPQTMHTALNIPGGVVDTVRQRGGNVIVQESDAVRITALHPVGAPRFARPVS